MKSRILSVLSSCSLVLAGLALGVAAPLVAQGTISAQVLRLLDTANTWTAVQTYSVAPVFSVVPTFPATATTLAVQTTSLTNAQVLTLPTSAVTIVTAPGSGYHLVLHLATLNVTATSGHYTNVSATGYLNLQYSNGDLASNYIANDAGVTPALTGLDILLKNNNRVTVSLREYMDTPDPASTGWGNAAFPSANIHDNLALQILATNSGGNFTGGNAANTVVVKAYYTIEAN